MILSAVLFFGFTTFISAQSSGSNGPGRRTGAAKTVRGKKPSEKLNNRKIYHFDNGQRSTPTGAEATGSATGGGFAALGKDTTPTVVTPATTTAATKKKTAKRNLKKH